MCGIAGLLRADAAYSKQTLNQLGEVMGLAIAHRGPDSAGVWADEEAGVVLSHRRLSIIDLSRDGAQPMESHSGRFVLTFNGEIYNYKTLQDELTAAGVQFKGRCDTEVLLAGIEHWGLSAALQKINGMYAFALWDKKERKVHFVRDRFGKKPLYIGYVGRDLVFASELKAFAALPNFERSLNPDALALFMKYASIPAPYSIYKDVAQLLPGYSLSLSLPDIDRRADIVKKMVPYWYQPRVIEEAFEKPFEGDEREAKLELERLLDKAVGQRMMSDVPLGALLSGGVDSSLVTALMQKHSTMPVKTFSVGFEDKAYNEANYAKQIADHLGTDHHTLLVRPQDALDVIPHLPQMYDEPFADISQIPTFLVSQFARSKVTVALSGDGGDEMFGGYQRHFLVPKLWRKVGWLPRPVRALMGQGAQSLSTGFWDTMRPGHPQFGERIHKFGRMLGAKSLNHVYDVLTSHWDDPLSILNHDTLPKARITEKTYALKGLTPLQRVMLADGLTYLPNDILTKVDRASMAVALEMRAPLLDKRLFEFMWRLDDSYKVRGGMGKYLLRQVAYKHVPRDILERPKKGFDMPVGAWLRGPLKDWAEELLDERAMDAQGLFNSDEARRVWDAHLAGQGNHATRLWTLLIAQAWLREWQVS